MQHGPREVERERGRAGERERERSKPSRLGQSTAADDDDEEEEEDAYQRHSHHSHHSHHRQGGWGGGKGEVGGGGGEKGGQHRRLAAGEREGARVSISPLLPEEYGFDPLTAGVGEKRVGKEVEASVPKGPLGVLFKKHAALSTLSGAAARKLNAKASGMSFKAFCQVLEDYF